MKMKKLMVCMVVAAFGLGTAAEAQVRQQRQQQQQQPSMQPGQQQAQTDVSDKELEKFVNVAQDVQEVQGESEQKMMSALESEGLDVQTFQQIQAAQQNPGNEGTPEGVSEEDMQSYSSAMMKIQEIQKESEEKMRQKISDGGMEFRRFQEISMALQQDPELQQRFRSMME